MHFSDDQRAHKSHLLASAPAQLLKTDIEGFEWEVFDDFFERGDVLPFSQILVSRQTPQPLWLSVPCMCINDANFGTLNFAGHHGDS